MLVSGCGRPKSKAASSGDAVDSFKSSALPVPPPPPETEPLEQDVTGAQADTVSAQKNVQTVLAAARTSDAPIAVQAVPPLSSADAKLTSAIVKLTSATQRIAALEDGIQKSEKARIEAEKIMRSDLTRLETACRDDNSESDKEIAKLQKENQELKDEDLNSAKRRLVGLGVLLLLVGAGGIVAIFMVGFKPGALVAKIAMPLGALCITLATMLQKIVWWTEVSLIVGFVLVLAYGAWHLFWHKPPVERAA